jgi:uncharacterized membrane protein YGL010W
MDVGGVWGWRLGPQTRVWVPSCAKASKGHGHGEACPAPEDRATSRTVTPMASPRKSADQWFAEYGESHQDDTNELIHWVCVPVIFFCVMGLIWSIPVPAALAGPLPWFNWLLPPLVAALLFYFRLSAPLAFGLLGFVAVCYGLIEVLALFSRFPVWQVSLVLFVLAWIGQFIGHKIEGKKPSFFKDVVFLLIGPAWLMHFIYKKLDIAY